MSGDGVIVIYGDCGVVCVCGPTAGDCGGTCWRLKEGCEVRKDVAPG